MPRHFEFLESCALCLPHGNSAPSVACDLLYKTNNLFFSLSLWFIIVPLCLCVLFQRFPAKIECFTSISQVIRVQRYKKNPQDCL